MAGAAGEALRELLRGRGICRRFRVGGKKPEDDADAQDDGAGTTQKKKRALKHVQKHVFHPRQPVGWQLHDHERRRAFEQRALEEPGEAERAERAESIHQHHEADFCTERDPVLRHERGDHQQIHGQPRGTAHEWRHENRDEPVLWILDGARGHDARNGTGIGAEEGDEAFAVETDAAHQAVHDERGPRHVTGAFEQPDEEKQNQDLRQKFNHAADAGDGPVGDEITQIAGGHRPFHQVGEIGRAVVEPVHRRLREREDADEEERHYRSEHQPAPDGMRGDGVDFVRCGRTGGSGLEHNFGRDPANRFVAGVDEGARPIHALGFPPLLPAPQDVVGPGMQRSGTGNPDSILIREEKERLSAGDER